MDFPDHDSKSIEAFLAACSPMMDAYQRSNFSYVAIKHQGELVLIQGRLRLSIVRWQTQATQFESKSICAGHYLLKDLGGDAQELLNSVLSGSLETPLGRPKLHADQSGRHSAHFMPFHDEGLRVQNRLNGRSRSAT
jgi:hypothetical protein